MLRIVGEGNSRALYERIIHDEQITDVFLEGRQDPIPYYKEASIFMMNASLAGNDENEKIDE